VAKDDNSDDPDDANEAQYQTLSIQIVEKEISDTLHDQRSPINPTALKRHSDKSGSGPLFYAEEKKN